MKELIDLFKRAQIVYTVVADPMMKGETKYNVIEQTTSLKYAIEEQLNYKGYSRIEFSLRIKKRD